MLKLIQYDDWYYSLIDIKDRKDNTKKSRYAEGTIGYFEDSIRDMFADNRFKPDKVTDDLEIQRISRSRAIRKIQEYARANDFDYFATFTIAKESGDRYSLEYTQDLLKDTFKKIRKYNHYHDKSKPDYIVVTEKHKDGAFHFHGLVKNIDTYTNEYGFLSNTFFDEIGFNSFSPIKDKRKVANYILKYITKDNIQSETGYYYFNSRGLKKATEFIVNGDIDFDWLFGDEYYHNDFVRKKDFNISDLTQAQKLVLLNLDYKSK